MSPTATKEADSKDDVKISKTEKRKKSDSTSKVDKEPSSKQMKQDKNENVYDEILKLEIKESVDRPPDKDLELWKGTCGELRTLLKDIFDIKTKNGGSQTEVSEKRIQASLLFVTLKKLNRLEKLRIKRSRDETNMAKQGVDSFNLQLQNLLYEVLHLKKEVTKCVNFKSADENLSLVSTQQFYEEAPESITCPTTTKTDEHALRLARLQWELSKRKELSEDAELREEERDRLENVIRKKDEKLRELGPQLASILKSTIPVQDYLGLPLSDKREQMSLARLLPPPLYVLYTQCHAYAQACDSDIDVRVKGDAEEARQFREDKDEDDDDDLQEESKEDSRDPEIEVEKLHRSKSVKKNDQTNKLMVIHPLEVEVKIKSDNNNSICVTFHWLSGLGVVTVTTVLSTKEKLDGEAMSPNTILSNLFEGDTGINSPNPANKWQLASAGMNETWSSFFPNKIPYYWVQKLSGLDFLSLKPVKEGEYARLVPSPDLASMHVEVILKSIRTRLRSRIDLQKQLDLLRQSKLSQLELLPSNLQSQFPVRVVSKLKSWNSTDWETYNLAEFTKHLVACGVVDAECSFYKATAVRDKATLTAFISIPASYPTDGPVFSLSLQVDEKKETVESCEMMRDLEKEINLGYKDIVDQVEGKLLMIMLHRMLVLLDVALEVRSIAQEANDGNGVSNFTKSQVFLETVKGKMRRFPFHFNSGQQMFQHS